LANNKEEKPIPQNFPYEVRECTIIEANKTADCLLQSSQDHMDFTSLSNELL